jgi:hypothetical protein
MRNTRNSLKILLSYTYYIAILAKAIYYGMSKSSDHLDRAAAAAAAAAAA